MRIAVMAAGAVGGYFGGRLAAAGHDVSFIARGAQLEAIRKNGLKIESPLGNLHLNNVRATSDPEGQSVRSTWCCSPSNYGTRKVAAETAKPLVGPKTRVITLQNGVDSVERIAPILGADHVVGRRGLYRDA